VSIGQYLERTGDGLFGDSLRKSGVMPLFKNAVKRKAQEGLQKQTQTKKGGKRKGVS